MVQDCAARRHGVQSSREVRGAVKDIWRSTRPGTQPHPPSFYHLAIRYVCLLFYLTYLKNLSVLRSHHFILTRSCVVTFQLQSSVFMFSPFFLCVCERPLCIVRRYSSLVCINDESGECTFKGGSVTITLYTYNVPYIARLVLRYERWFSFFHVIFCTNLVMRFLHLASDPLWVRRTRHNEDRERSFYRCIIQCNYSQCGC